MRRIAMLLALVLGPVLALADTAVIDGITWTYRVEHGNAILGGGDSSHPAVPTTTAGDLYIPSSIAGHPVTEIGYAAFYNCDGLTDVYIPDSVTTVWGSSFYDCDGLTAISFPQSVTTIGPGAFDECGNLWYVWIPDSVTSIGRKAFRACPKMKTFIVQDANQYYCSVGGLLLTKDMSVLVAGVNGDVVIPEGVTTIAEDAFSGRTGLDSVIFPDTLTSIEYGAFNSSSLKRVMIPGSVTTIDDYAFYACLSLISATILDGVTSIGDQAFQYCTKLECVFIPTTVTSIGQNAFNNTGFLTKVVGDAGDGDRVMGLISDSGRSTGGIAFTPWGTEAVTGGVGIKSCPYPHGDIVIPATVGGNKVVAILDSVFYDTDVTSVVIPDGVTSIGLGTFSNCGDLESVTIPGSVTTIGRNAFRNCSSLMRIDIPDGVTVIDEYTFAGCVNLERVTIPDGVTSIGTFAFYDCDCLESVFIPGSVATIGASAFNDCGDLESVTIQDGVTTIGNNAFAYCGNLECVSIPATVTSIGSGAFSGTALNKVIVDGDVDGVKAMLTASGLNISGINFVGWGTEDVEGGVGIKSCPYPYGDIVIPATVGGKKVVAILDSAFSSESAIMSVVIPEGVTSIGEYAFFNCYWMGRVTLPSTLTTIGNYAFNNCDDLMRVTIPGSVTTMGFGAFYQCEDLESVTIQEGVTTIGDYAFASCEDLMSVTLPSTLTTIGDHAFYYCEKLESVTIPDGVTSIGTYAFYDCDCLESVFIPGSVATIGASAFNDCGYLESVTIQDGVATIGDSAFSGCGSLKSVTIPGSVTGIGEYAFGDCDGLESVTIQDGVTAIGDRAFDNCDKLANVEIPLSVAEIGEQAFQWCPLLTSVTISSSVTAIGNEAFYCTGLNKVYVESGDKDRVSGMLSGSGLNVSGIEFVVPTVTMTFDANGGTGGGAEELEWGAALTAPTVTRTGYSLKGWSPELPAKVPAVGTTYKAQWTINKYTIKFDANGGEGGTTQTLTYNTALTAPTVTRTGYTFKSWSPAVPSKVPAQNATYKAQWTANKYTIKFDANGGEGGWSKSLAYNSALTAPTVTRTGYTFKSWSPAVPSKVPAQNATYKAQWTINKYTIKFDANGGEGGTTQTLTYNTALAAPTVTRTGYTFKSWSPAVPAKVPAQNTTYKAQWTANKYTIKFDANGGTGGTTQSLTYNTALAAPTVTRTGYTFKSWSPAVPSKVPAQNATYKAQWTVNKYTIKFDANGGNGGTTQSLAYNTALTAPTVTRTGYTFKSWSPAVPAKVPAQNATYKAQWTANKYTIKFDANGGEGGTTQSLAYNTALTAPTVTREGYTFKSWSPAVPSKVPAQNATYKAQWDVNKYTVTFDANGGEGGWSKDLSYNSTITAPTVTREGYRFDGWTPAVAAKVPAKNVIYTAQWTRSAYTIIFDANGGEGGTVSEMLPGTALVCPEVELGGMVFAGWSPVPPTLSPASNATYVAQWVVPTTQTWETEEVAGGVAITGCSYPYGDLVLPAEIGGKKVVAIQKYAFFGCSGITSISMPDGVQEIGLKAVKGCSNLKSVRLPSGLKTLGQAAFQDCVSLTEVDVPAGIDYLWSSTFEGCLALERVSLPEGITAIGTSSFANCGSLKYVNIPSTVKSIKSFAFFSCASLANVELPYKLVTIEQKAFKNCTAMEGIAIPSSVKTLGKGAFFNTGLVEATVPGSVAKVDDYCFQKCAALKKMTLGEGVVETGASVWANDEALVEFVFPVTLQKLGSFAFFRCYSLTTLWNFSSLSALSTPGVKAFKYCTSLKTLSMPSQLVEIPDEMCNFCEQLKTVNGTMNVKAIGKSAFSNCPALTSVAGLDAAALKQVKAGKAWSR